MPKVDVGVKRWIKGLRNHFVDPLPRMHVLSLSAIRIDGPLVRFDYQAKGRSYVITLMLPDALGPNLHTLAPSSRDQILTAIGIAFSAFFFKLTDFKTLSVETAPLDDASKTFFEDFLQGGLGEFRFLQGLDPSRRIAVRAITIDQPVEPATLETEDHLLMLNGGGKDTVVAAEMLRGANQRFSWVTIRPNAARRKVIELSGVGEAIEVGYETDEAIESDKVYPWAHIPHTSIVLSIGVLVAMLTKARYVAAGNELSADHGNLRHKSVEVNHQYTKSSTYESGFASFVKRRVTGSVSVFSILRPFHDLQLARMFAGLDRYHGAFISCNRGIGRGQWCKTCPKCAFTALALSPFLDDAGLRRIFGEDILSRPVIRRRILELVLGSIKPWECVGTRDECTLALALLLKGRPDLEFAEPPLRDELQQAVAGADIPRLRREICDSPNHRHRIPQELLAKLQGGSLWPATTQQLTRLESSSGLEKCTDAIADSNRA